MTSYGTMDSINKEIEYPIMDDVDDDVERHDDGGEEDNEGYSSEDSTEKAFIQKNLLISNAYNTAKQKKLEGSHKSVKSLKSLYGTDQNANMVMTISNMCVLLQGSAMFGMCYAVMKAGLLVIPGFVLVSILADMTALYLIDCMYDISPKSGRRKRVRTTYDDIAAAAWGPKGARVVGWLNMFYMAANNIVNVVLLGQSIFKLLGPYLHWSESVTMAVFSLLFIPPLFIRRLSVLSYLSLIGVLSIMLGTLTALVVYAQHWRVWASTASTLPLVDLQYYPLGLGIYMYSIVIHPLLPDMEGVMIKPKEVGRAIHVSYSVSTVIKAIFGTLGALTFGLATEQLVALNVSEFSMVANVIMTLACVGYALTSFALLMFVISANLDKVCVDDRFPNLAQGGRWNNFWMLISRTLLVGLCLAVAKVVPYFALVSGVVGSLVGMLLVFMFPLIFHLQLKWGRLSKMARAGEIVLVVIGTIIGILTLYSSTRTLIETLVKAHA